MIREFILRQREENEMKLQKGFTLIELIMVIVILSILAIVAVPRFVNLQTNAQQGQEDGVVGGVRGGVLADHAQRLVNNTNPVWPATLDAIAAFPTACSNAAPCFNTILDQGGVQGGGWTKTAQNATTSTYTGPTGSAHVYDNTTGSFT